MAETGVNVTEGSGKTVATDQVGSYQFQQVKIVDGTIGSSIAAIVDSTGALKVTGGSSGGSVSGTVGASIIGTVPITQGGPFVASVSGQIGASVIGNVPVTVTNAVGITGTVNASIVGTVPVVQSGTVITSVSGIINISGSIFGSVSGTVGASIIGNVPVSITQSISIPVTQSGAWTTSVVGTVFIAGSVAAISTAAANQSVSGTVGASIIGVVPVNVISGGGANGSSVSGTVGASIVGQLPAGTAVLGSIATLQATNPWIVASSIAGGIFPISGSVAATITNTSINVSGSVAALITNTNINVSGSVASFQAGTQITSVSGIVNIAGSVVAVVTGTLPPQSVSGTVGASIIGLPPVLIYQPYVSSTQGVTSVMTGTSSVLVLAAPGGTSRNYITHILVTNGSNNATTVTIQDGASILWGGFAAANGGGWTENFNPPLPQPTSVKALYATSSVQASIIVAISGFTGV